MNRPQLKPLTPPPGRAVRSLHAEAVEEIARWVLGGSLQPGDILPNELEIGERLNVSRTVVREAVRTLVAKGMLQVRRKTGTVVLPETDWSMFDPDVLAWRFRHQLDARLVEDLFSFRSGIEIFAAELCAANPAFDAMALMRSCEAMQAALEGRGDWIEADLTFHRLLLEGSGNQFLFYLTPMLENLFDALFTPDVLEEENMRATLPRHREVAAAIADRDTDKVRQAMRRLIDEARQDVMRKIPTSGGARK